MRLNLFLILEKSEARVLKKVVLKKKRVSSGLLLCVYRLQIHVKGRKTKTKQRPIDVSLYFIVFYTAKTLRQTIEIAYFGHSSN